MKRCGIVVLVLGLVPLLAHAQWVAPVPAVAQAPEEIPVFEYDPTWPKPLPNYWNTGNIGGISIDSQDHIWVVHRPDSTTSLAENYGLTGEGECCFPAPPVLEFDQDGNLLQSWGPIHDRKGGLLGKQVWTLPQGVKWPGSEHGIYVDNQYVYVDGTQSPSQVVKFTRDGKYVRRFGNQDAKSNNDTENLLHPTQMIVDPKTNELYVGDGDGNRRVIVFDATTGAYKRHWGAYGHRPVDAMAGTLFDYDPKAPLSTEFSPHVHCVAQSKDDLIYVCDCGNHRMQVFQTDGRFVREVRIGEQFAGGYGTVHGVGFSVDPEQKFLYLADGGDKKIWILRRSDLKVLGSFSSGGRGGGQVMIVHALAVDSKGNVYVGESIDSNRVQRFNFKGMRRIP